MKEHEQPKKQNDHENENQLLTERTVTNETNDNRILDTDIINPSNYKFEHGSVKKEVKKDVKSEYIMMKEVKKEEQYQTEYAIIN